MKQTPRSYLAASVERIGAAEDLFRTGRFAEAVYIAGVAVECLLHAYRSRRRAAFDARHDLPELLRMSGLEELIPEGHRQRLSAALGEVWASMEECIPIC